MTTSTPAIPIHHHGFSRPDGSSHQGLSAGRPLTAAVGRPASSGTRYRRTPDSARVRRRVLVVPWAPYRPTGAAADVRPCAVLRSGSLFLGVFQHQIVHRFANPRVALLVGPLA